MTYVIVSTTTEQIHTFSKRTSSDCTRVGYCQEKVNTGTNTDTLTLSLNDTFFISILSNQF